MSNTYFQFKQFTIHQDKCAMKVCTDACLFAAWVARKFEERTNGIRQILDIGAGTGLLSLMLAQKIAGAIDAVEISTDAALQARENVALSAWANRIMVFNTALQEFKPAATYDLIVSNPPFFEADLKSADQQRNAAMHDSTLRLDELIHFIQQNISEEGFAAVLLPFRRQADFERIVEKAGMKIQSKVNIRQSPQHVFFRTFYLLSKKLSGEIEYDEIIIRDNTNQYTLAFSALLKDYYLQL